MLEFWRCRWLGRRARGGVAGCTRPPSSLHLKAGMHASACSWAAHALSHPRGAIQQYLGAQAPMWLRAHSCCRCMLTCTSVL